MLRREDRAEGDPIGTVTSLRRRWGRVITRRCRLAWILLLYRITKKIIYIYIFIIAEAEGFLSIFFTITIEKKK